MRVLLFCTLDDSDVVFENFFNYIVLVYCTIEFAEVLIRLPKNDLSLSLWCKINHKAIITVSKFQTPTTRTTWVNRNQMHSFNHYLSVSSCSNSIGENYLDGWHTEKTIKWKHISTDVIRLDHRLANTCTSHIGHFNNSYVEMSYCRSTRYRKTHA